MRGLPVSGRVFVCLGSVCPGKDKERGNGKDVGEHVGLLVAMIGFWF